MVAPDDGQSTKQRPPAAPGRVPVVTRMEELTRLRQMALNEGLPLVERARAVVDRLWLIDDILSEELNRLDSPDGGTR